jgi:uncharacterized protein (TIGR03792 family)
MPPSSSPSTDPSDKVTHRPHSYSSGERLPIEVLVFEMDPADVEAFLRIDHEVWTLGEAEALDGDDVPFLSKEVWLNEQRPGEITIVFVWPDQQTWDEVGSAELMERLQSEFDRCLGRPYQLTREVHVETDYGLHRWSRFDRTL